MVKKSQLKKYSAERIMELVGRETSGEQIKLLGEAISDRNRALLERREALAAELGDVRKRVEKVVREMNDGVKDRIQLKSKVVLDKGSRPTSEDIKQIADLFAYLENQHNLIKRNSQDLQHYQQALLQTIDSARPRCGLRADPSDLEEQYLQLNEQCAREQAVKEQLLREREASRRHYGSISSSIEQYRLEYDFVEERIREKERELVQLASYLSSRSAQDQSLLQRLRESNMSLESELLKAQEILNSHSSKCEQLMIREIQTLAQPL